MAYEVSEKITKTLNTLTGSEPVKKALSFMEEDNEYIIQKQIEMTLIPSPTFHEQEKAARVIAIFKEYGLEDRRSDAHLSEVWKEKAAAYDAEIERQKELYGIE